VQKINPTKKQTKQTTPEATNQAIYNSRLRHRRSSSRLVDQCSPVIYCFFILLNRFMSNITHSMPSSMPICEPKPRASSIMKKMQDQNGAPGNSTIACVNTMKASPVPSAA
jgi:hypothetical protein